MIKKLITQLENKRSAVPRPFPGKWPTRIHIKSLKDTTPYEYFGKLTPSLLADIRRSYIAKGGYVDYLQYAEMDQNGKIMGCYGGQRDFCVTFAELYIPYSKQVTDDFFRGTWIYYLLSRVPTVIDGRLTTKIELLKGTKYEEAEQQMVQDCARGRVGRDWFPKNDWFEAAQIINAKAQEWMRVDAVKPTKPTAKGFAIPNKVAAAMAKFRMPELQWTTRPKKEIRLTTPPPPAGLQPLENVEDPPQQLGYQIVYGTTLAALGGNEQYQQPEAAPKPPKTWIDEAF